MTGPPPPDRPLPRSGDRIALGVRGETLAAAYLQGRGLRIRQQNFRTRIGEIDLVAETAQGHLVFVEVRSRFGHDGFSPVDSIDAPKRRQVRRVVQAYLDAIDYRRRVPVRIDVVGIIFGPHSAHIEHIPDAF